MNFDHSDQQKTIRQEIIDFCRAELNAGIEERDRAGEFPCDLFAKIGAGPGLQGLPIDPRSGGRGLDPLTTIVALEAFGYACEDNGLVLAVCAHLLATAVPFAEFASDAQKAEFLPGLCAGSKIGTSCMTEPGAGSDLASVATSAVRDGDGYLLNGTKTLATNGPVADVATVFAVTDPEADLDGRLTPFIIASLDAPGITRGEGFDLLGNRTAAVGEISFENVRLPGDAVLGGREGSGREVFEHAMNWERVGLFAAHVGTMQRLTEISIKRARTRKQSGKAIGKFDSIAHTSVDMKARLEASRMLVYRAAAKLDRGRARDVALDASVAKLFVAEAYVQAAHDALRIHGGAGYLNDTGLARPLRDATGSTLYSGTSEIQKNHIARSLGL